MMELKRRKRRIAKLRETNQKSLQEEGEREREKQRERMNEKVEASEEFFMSRYVQPVSRYVESWKQVIVTGTGRAVPNRERSADASLHQCRCRTRSSTERCCAEEERNFFAEMLRPDCTQLGAGPTGAVPKRREIFCQNAPVKMYPNASPKFLMKEIPMVR